MRLAISSRPITILVAAHVTLPRVAAGLDLPIESIWLGLAPAGRVPVPDECSYRGPRQTRPLWLLLGSGFLLASIGEIALTYSAFSSHLQGQTQVFNFDFFFFAYGIPVLLAICSRDKDVGLKTFAWLDGMQALDRRHPGLPSLIFGVATIRPSETPLGS